MNHQVSAIPLTLTKETLGEFIVETISVSGLPLDCSYIDTLTMAGECVIEEEGGSASIEALATEWARHWELKEFAAFARQAHSPAAIRIMQTICNLASVVDDKEQSRLDLIQRLAGWKPTHGQNLDDLMAEAAALMG